MILDNLTRAIRDQNWFAVGIELVIVILGVVIGFQVNAWNEDRQAEQRLERHLAAVYEELGENALRLNAFVTKVEDDLANMRDFMAWIADPDAPPERLHRYLFHLLPVANLELEQGNQARLQSSERFIESGLDEINEALNRFDRRAIELLRANRDLVRFRNDYVHVVLADSTPFIDVLASGQPRPQGLTPGAYPPSVFSIDAATVRADRRYENMAAMKIGLSTVAVLKVPELRSAIDAARAAIVERLEHGSNPGLTG